MVDITLNDFEQIEDKKEAKKVLKSISDQNSDREIADHWGLSMPQVRKMRVDLGIRKRATNGRKKALKKQAKATGVFQAGNLDYHVSIEGTLTGEMLFEKLDELKTLLSAMSGEMFEVKIQSGSAIH